MPTLFAFLIRVLIVAAGLVLAASVLVAAAVGAVLWGLHAAWARLTGRPVRPFIVRMRRAPAFRWPAEHPAAAPQRRRMPAGDVVDVEPKSPM